MHTLLIDNLSTAIIKLNTFFEIEYLNPAAEILLAVSRRRVYGHNIGDIFFEEDSSIIALHNAVKSGNPFTKRETKLRLSNNKTLLVDYTVTPLINKESLVEDLLIEFYPRDRMQRISQEDELLVTHQTSKELIRGLAHEIKNPLGGIRGAAQLISRSFKDEELKDYTQVIIEESDRLRDLVDRLLGPRQLPKNKRINIHKVTERVNQLVNVEAQGQVTLTRDYDPSIPELIGDSSQLIQALLNIMRNAMQALLLHDDNTGKNIRIITRALRQFTIGSNHHRLVCKISIVDNGPGIPKNLLKTLFYPMVSGHPEGTGLGLSIAQSIIHQHNGLIECDSGPSQTQFNILLPIEISI